MDQCDLLAGIAERNGADEMPNQPRITETEVANRAGVDVQTILRWRRTGRMPNAIMLGTKSRPPYRWDTDAIEAWLAAGGANETEAGQ